MNNSWHRDIIVLKCFCVFRAADTASSVSGKSVAAIQDEKPSAEKETRVDAFTHARTHARIEKDNIVLARINYVKGPLLYT